LKELQRNAVIHSAQHKRAGGFRHIQFFARDSVRAFLPAAALAFCACGGSGSTSTPSAAAGAQGGDAAARANNAPTIAAAEANYARVGSPYVFQPNASDPEGDPLTFSSENLPPWARLDPATGRITGTPSSSDVGAYESIVIAVADASHSVKTGAFTITVLSTAAGMATLNWEAPVTKVNGSPLDDLAGYRIMYGHSPDDLDRSVFVDGAQVRTYEFAELEGGIWYFAVVAVNANGLEGPPSTAAMKSI
jgi:hypothetical protein